MVDSQNISRLTSCKNGHKRTHSSLLAALSYRRAVHDQVLLLRMPWCLLTGALLYLQVLNPAGQFISWPAAYEWNSHRFAPQSKAGLLPWQLSKLAATQAEMCDNRLHPKQQQLMFNALVRCVLCCISCCCWLHLWPAVDEASQLSYHAHQLREQLPVGAQGSRAAAGSNTIATSPTTCNLHDKIWK
jgi:hypothetical protein